MGLHTGIEWCDSTINPMMGCDGKAKSGRLLDGKEYLQMPRVAA